MQFFQTVPCLSTTIDWRFIVISSHLCMPSRLQISRGQRRFLPRVIQITPKHAFNRRLDLCWWFNHPNWLLNRSGTEANSLSQPIGPTTEIVSSKFVLNTDWFKLAQTFIKKGNISSPGALFSFTTLDSNQSHYHRSPMVWTYWELSIILVHNCKLGNCFDPCPLLFMPSLWPHHHENH